jgi:hypothetical protein
MKWLGPCTLCWVRCQQPSPLGQTRQLTQHNAQGRGHSMLLTLIGHQIQRLPKKIMFNNHNLVTITSVGLSLVDYVVQCGQEKNSIIYRPRP